MATSADVAMVATRRPTGTFPGAGASASGAAGTGITGTGDPAVGCSAADGAGGGGAGWRGGTRFASAGLLTGGGLEWSPLCQVCARITWVCASLTFSVCLEALVGGYFRCRTATGR